MGSELKILILDFGSQTTALIGRRIREFGVYSETAPGDSALEGAILEGVKGIVLSGSPESVYAGGPRPDPRIYGLGLPLLGICYGIQVMTRDNGGKIAPLEKREYGGVKVSIDNKIKFTKKSPNWAAFDFFSGFLERGENSVLNIFTGQKFISSFKSWMSHGDTIVELAPGFVQAGTSENGLPAIVYHAEKPWFGLQFHPEASHCELGGAILKSFALDVCRCSKNWSVSRYLDEVSVSLRKQTAGRYALILISGGVDSSVAAAILLKVMEPEKLHLMYIDTGLMREGETGEVRSALEKLGAKNIHVIHAETEFLSALEGISQPEEKRRVIGDLFIKIQEREVERLALPEDYFLVQGTLYTDLIESGKGIGKSARLIKSHHNVGSPLVEAKRAAGKIIEPLDKLYKDEVRALGRLLLLDEELIGRHPFPGPGLAVRILGEITHEKCEILRKADSIFINELKSRKNPLTGRRLYDEIWQAFAVLLPVCSVGVAGDGRKYGWVLALRAVTSADGMTADVYKFNADDIACISTAITNLAPEIGRVVLDISSKPPATIEWE